MQADHGVVRAAPSLYASEDWGTTTSPLFAGLGVCVPNVGEQEETASDPLDPLRFNHEIHEIHEK